MSVDSGMDVLVLLLYAKGETGKVNEPIRGITRLEKLMYLLDREGEFHKYLSNYQFVAYDYGPFSSRLWDDIETLKDESLGLVEVQEVSSSYFIETSDAEKAMEEESELKEKTLGSDAKKKVEIYSLSERGEKVANQLFNELSAEERSILENIKRRFNSMSLFELIRYVYLKYPESTVYSKIRSDILGEAAGG
jgi:uncharacterized protein YwgA